MKSKHTSEILKGRLDGIQEVESKLEKGRNSELLSFIDREFKSCMIGDTEVRNGPNYFEFCRTQQEGEKYKREIFSVNFENDSWREEAVTKIKISAYSTSTTSDYELERLISLGSASQTVLTKRDLLIEEYNKIFNKSKKKLSEIRKERYALEKEIRELKEFKEDLEKKRLFNRLQTKGVNFVNMDSDGKVNKGVCLEVRFNDEKRYITSIKIESMSASGKSCNLLLGQSWPQWTYDKENVATVVQEEQEIRVSNVRTEKVKRVIQYYSKSVVEKDTVAS